MASSGPRNPAFLVAIGVALGAGIGVIMHDVPIGSAIGADMVGIAAAVLGRR